MGKVFKSDREEPPVTYSDVNVNDAMPGYKNEPTPQHTYSDTGVMYPGPAAIPPTQPGYTNYPTTEGAQPNPYPAYPPAPAQAGIYPPIQAPYPPADGGLPYPVQPGNPAAAYPPLQQAYNPTAPP